MFDFYRRVAPSHLQKRNDTYSVASGRAFSAGREQRRDPIYFRRRRRADSRAARVVLLAGRHRAVPGLLQGYEGTQSHRLRIGAIASVPEGR